jgi:hypothetical protein
MTTRERSDDSLRSEDAKALISPIRGKWHGFHDFLRFVRFVAFTPESSAEHAKVRWRIRRGDVIDDGRTVEMRNTLHRLRRVRQRFGRGRVIRRGGDPLAHARGSSRRGCRMVKREARRR